MKKLLVFAFIVVMFAPCLAVTREWVARYNGPGSMNDWAQAIAVDASGNVYVTGNNDGGSGTSQDYITVKYDAYGNYLWASRYNGPGNSNDNPAALVVDSSGNVYVTGQSAGSGTGSDYATIKYNSSGDQQWVARYNGPPGNDNDYANALAIDDAGNVYVTGMSVGSGTFYDFATIKYNSSGDEQWAARYNGPASGSDVAKAIAVDSSGNVYVTGYHSNSGAPEDCATIKYNSTGDQQWLAVYSGPGNGHDNGQKIVLDSSGNIYVAGFVHVSVDSVDFLAIKYDETGNQTWVRTYDGPGNSNDNAVALAVDSSGNVYVGGQSTGSGTSADYATVKYNSSGDQQWVARYNGPANNQESLAALAVDSSGNVYVAGNSMGSGTDFDMATIKYGPDGTELWVDRYDGPGHYYDDSRDLALGSLGSIYVTGTSSSQSGKGNYLDYLTIKYFEDLVFPSVSAVVPIEILKDTAVEFNVTATDNVNVTGCDFYWDGSNVSSMTNIGSDVWAANYTPLNAGTFGVWANCSDADGNTNKTNTTVVVNTLPYLYSQDYDGSAEPADYAATFGGEQNASYDWANAVEIHVPTFTTGWILLNLSMPGGATESTLAVFKYDSVANTTTQLSPGIYGLNGTYNVTDNRIYVNLTAGDPDIGGVGLLGGGTGTEVGTAYAAPEADLFLLMALFCLAILGFSARKR